MKFAFGFAYIPLYFVWVAYRAFIRHDLKQHRNDFYGLTFLVFAWGLI